MPALQFAIGVFAASVTAQFGPQFNPSDLPDRCPVSQVSLSDDDFGWDNFLKVRHTERKEKDTDLFYMDILIEGDMRMTPLPAVMTFMKETNFFERRPVLYPKFEKRIAALTDPKARLKGYGNYAMALLYLGDFKKLIEFFGPGSKLEADFNKDATVTFALANAYWRRQEWELASKYANLSFKLNDQLDARWMLMASDVGLHGKDWVAHHDDESYTTKFVTEIFPAPDWRYLPFEDVTQAMGIHNVGGTGSISFADLDGDNWDDLIFERKFFPFQMFKNVNGKFELQPAAKMGKQDCAQIIAVPGDYDNDGKPDIFRHCCNYDGAGPVTVMHNEGELTFTDVTKKSGLAFTDGYGMVVAWADYDLDGFLDIAVGDANGTTRLYHNTGKGTFTLATKAGIATPGKFDGLFGTVGVSFGDLDEDGYPDLFIQGWGWKRLYMNKRDGTFKDVTNTSGLNKDTAIKGYTNQMFDYDGDGKLDLYAGQYVVSSGVKWGFAPICTCSNLLKKEGYQKREWEHASTIYKNNGDGTFTDMAATTHFIPLGTMGANNADWDNDGDEDLVMGAGGPYFQQAEPFLFYENQGDGTFALRTPFYDLHLWGKGHGASFADYDHDGNVDLMVNNGGATPGDSWPSMLFHNKGNANHWFEVAFKADLSKGTNSQAMGAKVWVTAGGKTQVQEYWSGGRFGAANGSRLHFGLGKNAKIEKVVIRWPNKTLETTTLTGLDVDQAIEVTEATGQSKQLWSFPHGEGKPNHK